VRSFFLPIVLLSNFYGYGDAVLRFPSVPELDSFFCVKLLVAVIAKTVAYSVGFIDVHRWALLFLSALFLNVWLPPVLYVLAIPFGDTSPFRKDRDMLLRIMWILLDSRERSEMVHIARTSFESFRREIGALLPRRIELHEKSYL
jgi:hypothetical protein